MRDPRTREWADDGDPHAPAEAVATHEQRPEAPIWNRVMDRISDDIRYLFGQSEDDNHDGSGAGSETLNPHQVTLEDGTDATREVWTQVDGDWDEPEDTHYLLLAQTDDTSGRLSYQVTGYRETGTNSWTIATLDVLATISSDDEIATSLSVRNSKQNRVEHNTVTCEYDGDEWVAIEMDTDGNSWGYDGGLWYTGVRKGSRSPELVHDSDVSEVEETEDEGYVSFPGIDVQGGDIQNLDSLAGDLVDRDTEISELTGNVASRDAWDVTGPDEFENGDVVVIR